MGRYKRVLAAVAAVALVMFAGCADLNAASRAKARIGKIPVAAEDLVLCGGNHITICGKDYSLPKIASDLLKGRKPDLYQNTTYYGEKAAYYTVVYDRNNDRREEEGCKIALFRFDYATGEGKLLRDMAGTFPVQSYPMASPTVLEALDEEGGHCMLVENGALEIVSAETGAIVWSQQVFGAKDYFGESSKPYSFRNSDMVFAFSSETVSYYRYAGTMYEVFTFENEGFKTLSSGDFGVIDGAIYAESGGQIVYAADLVTGEPRDIAEIAALVEATDAERDADREKGSRLEAFGDTFWVTSDPKGVYLAPETGERLVISVAELHDRSEEMRTIEQIYAEEFPEKTPSFTLGCVVSDGRLFVTAEAKLEGYGMLDLYTPVLVFEYGLSGGGFSWCGYHGGERLWTVRYL